MDFNNIKIEQLVKYVNIELKKNKSLSVNKLCSLIGIPKSTLRDRMTRGGYYYNAEKRMYEITSNITPVEPTKQAVQEVKEVSNKDISLTPLEGVVEPLKGTVDMDKLTLLIDNLDSLLALVNKSNITSNTGAESSFRSGKNDVKSLRLDTGLYEEVKNRATSNITIGAIINKAIEDYLNNYI